MVSKEQRRHELARAKLLRQQARREAEAKRRRLVAIIAAGVAILVVIGGVTFLSLRDTDGADPIAGDPTTTATTTAPDDDAPRAGRCKYTPTGDASKEVVPPPDGRPAALSAASATITTDQGDVEIDLDPEVAPCTVQSFLTLAEAGYFDATVCHRLTTSGSLKVLQCGDPSGTGSGGPGYAFNDETSADMTYERGVVAMANSGPDTNGSQFFLVYGDSDLPPDYTVFGHITGGLDVLDAIAEAGVDGGGTDGAPATPVTITSVAVVSDAASEDAGTQSVPPTTSASEPTTTATTP